MALAHDPRRSSSGLGQQAGPTTGDAERWARVKAVFLEALDRPKAERNEFLAVACAGDDDLRRDVESLLASDESAASFCETPAAALLASGSDAPPLEPSPGLRPGDRLGAYEITAFIAAGGMGEVYRARHVLLGREVALKTVAARDGDDTARQRLIREAQHASILKHPGICTIHEVGEERGTPFIVMEYVDGEPLSAILRERRPELGVALALGIQVADALEHAHEHGIIHRDLKSSNIVVDAEGRAIVLDFGLAKRLPQSGDDRTRESSLTVAGALAGTLSHMAPEVLLGRPADARSDVWALGVLLYELATGELPFKGRTPYETSSAILADSPRAMAGSVPLALRLVTERCLMKDPGARYQRAADVRSALDAIRRRRSWPLLGPLLVSVRLRALQGVAAAVLLIALLVVGGARLRERLTGVMGRQVSTLALLPLANATGDPSAQYYADGLTDGLIAQLGSIGNVRIISRASAERVARETVVRAEIARRLGADVIVEGALRRASERIEIDMRIVEPSRGRVLWSESYERGARDVLALQADVVRELALAIRLAVRPQGLDRLAVIRAVSPDAYEAYLKGRYEWNLRTRESLQRAIGHFTRAVRLDPTYAPAHAALADCYNQLGTVMVGTGSPREWRPRAAAEAIRALQIDPYSAEAHATLGYVRHYQWQWQEAEKELRRAIELNPSAPLPRIWYANLLMSRRRMDEAVREVFAARELDPFSLIVLTNVGWVLDGAGREQEAIDHFDRALALDSTFPQARHRLVTALMNAGRPREAIEQASRLMRLTNGAPPYVALLAQTEARVGRRAEASALLRDLLARSEREYVSPWAIATVYMALGDMEGAVAWAEKTFDEGSNAVAYFAVEPTLAPMRNDPRFRALMARAGLE